MKVTDTRKHIVKKSCDGTIEETKIYREREVSFWKFFKLYRTNRKEGLKRVDAFDVTTSQVMED